MPACIVSLTRVMRLPSSPQLLPQPRHQPLHDPLGLLPQIHQRTPATDPAPGEPAPLLSLLSPPFFTTTTTPFLTPLPTTFCHRSRSSSCRRRRRRPAYNMH